MDRAKKPMVEPLVDVRIECIPLRSSEGKQVATTWLLVRFFFLISLNFGGCIFLFLSFIPSN